jgi:MoaA/NifB/PqqE/SkfB family radical SAM enzyme
VTAPLTVDDIQPQIGSMTVEVTTHCSLRCVGCSRTVGREVGEWRDRHMAASLFARICGHLPRLARLVLHGIGEPTLNPEYRTIVEMAARSGRFDVIWANTHALSRTIDYYRALVDAGLSHLAVSVDSLTQQVADRTRTGTDVARLRARLHQLASLPIPVSLTMVASRFNIDDMPATFDALNAIGPFEVQLQPFFDLGRADGCLTRDDIARVRGLVADESPARWPNLTIGPVLSLSGTEPPALCDAPWSGPAVTVDGYLTPCCVMWDPSVLGFIDVAAVSVEDALSLPAFSSFLAAYLRRAPGFCGACQINRRPVHDTFVALQRHPASLSAR